MKHFLSGVMAAGWFCLAMAVLAQSISAPSEPVTTAPAAARESSAHIDCLKQAIDQKIVGPQRRDFLESCMTED